MAESKLLLNTSKFHEDFLLCTLCLHSFTKPKVLVWLHTFCCACLETLASQNCNESLICPLCRTATDISHGGVQELKDNFFVEGVKEYVSCNNSSVSHCELELCDICSLDATYFCRECNFGLCQTCVSDHNKFPSLQFHSVSPISIKSIFQTEEKCTSDANIEVTKGDGVPDCIVHQGYKNCMYCSSCKTKLCPICSETQGHSGHKLSTTHKFVAETMEHLLQKEEELLQSHTKRSELLEKLTKEVAKLESERGYYFSQLNKKAAELLANFHLELDNRIATIKEVIEHDHEIQKDLLLNQIKRNESEMHTIEGIIATTKDFKKMTHYVALFDRAIVSLDNHKIIRPDQGIQETLGNRTSKYPELEEVLQFDLLREVFTGKHNCRSPVEKDTGMSTVEIYFKTSELKVLDQHYSRPYNVHGNRWRILVRRKKKDKSEYMFNVFLEWMENSQDGFKANLEYTLVNFKDQSLNITKYAERKFTNTEKDWGYFEFITWNRLVNPASGFTQDGYARLIIQLTTDQG